MSKVINDQSDLIFPLDQAMRLNESYIINSRWNAQKNAVEIPVGRTYIINKLKKILEYDPMKYEDTNIPYIYFQVCTTTISTETDPKPRNQIHVAQWGENYKGEWSGIGWVTVYARLSALITLQKHGFLWRLGIKHGGNDVTNFVGANGISLDLDKDSKIDSTQVMDLLLAHKINPAIIHYSPNGNPENNFMRGVILFDRVVKDYEKLTQLIKGINNILPNAATNVHDPTRFFYSKIEDESVDLLYTYLEPDVLNDFDSLYTSVADPSSEIADDSSDDQKHSHSSYSESDSDDENENETLAISSSKHIREHILKRQFNDSIPAFISDLVTRFPKKNLIDRNWHEHHTDPLSEDEWQGCNPVPEIADKSNSKSALDIAYRKDGSIIFNCNTSNVSGLLHYLYYMIKHDCWGSYVPAKQAIIEMLEDYNAEPFTFVPKAVETGWSDHHQQIEKPGYLPKIDLGYYSKVRWAIDEECHGIHEETEEHIFDIKKFGSLIDQQWMQAAFYECQNMKLLRLSGKAYVKVPTWIYHNGKKWEVLSFNEVAQMFQDWVNNLPIPYVKYGSNTALYNKYETVTDRQLKKQPFPVFRIDEMPEPYYQWIGFSNGILNIDTKEFRTDNSELINCRTVVDFPFIAPAFPGKTKDEAIALWKTSVNPVYHPILEPLMNVITLNLTGYLNRIIVLIGQPGTGKSLIEEIMTTPMGRDNYEIYRGKEYEGFENNADKDARSSAVNKGTLRMQEASVTEVGADYSKSLSGSDKVSRMLVKIRNLYTPLAEYWVIWGLLFTVNSFPIDNKDDSIYRRVILILHQLQEGIKKDTDLRDQWVGNEQKMKDLFIDCCMSFSEDDLEVLRYLGDVDSTKYPEIRSAMFSVMAKAKVDSLQECFDDVLEYVPYVPGEPEHMISYEALGLIVGHYMSKVMGRRDFKMTNASLAKAINDYLIGKGLEVRPKGDSSSKAGTTTEKQTINVTVNGNKESTKVRGCYRVKPVDEYFRRDLNIMGVNAHNQVTDFMSASKKVIIYYPGYQA